MFNRLKQIYQNIKELSHSIDKYKNDSIVQSLPTVALVNKAKKLIEKQNYEEAKQTLLSALDISGQDALIYKYLGAIAENEKNFSQAKEYYEKAVELEKNDKDSWLRLGMNSLYSEKLERAIEAFEQANKLSPNNTDIYTGWGMTYMRMKKYQLAKDKFNMAAKISKYNFTAILLSAVMEIRCGEYSIAEDKLNFLTKVAPNESSNYEYAHLKLIQNKYEQAITYANKAIEINKQMMPAYLILGEAYSVQKDYENTQITFIKALKEDLDCAILRFEWGKAYTRLLDFNNAQKEFEESLNLDSNFTEAKIGLALIKAHNNDFYLLDELKEKYTHYAYIQEALGLEYLHQTEYEKAIEMFKKALQTDKNQTFNYYNLAQCYISQNDKYKTREYFDKFLQAHPESEFGLINYAKWLTSVSDYEEAQRKLEKALKINPANIETLNSLFFTQYTLVKNNVCEYNIKEALSLANKAIGMGRFDYTPQKQELENLLKNIQGN